MLSISRYCMLSISYFFWIFSIYQFINLSIYQFPISQFPISQFPISQSRNFAISQFPISRFRIFRFPFSRFRRHQHPPTSANISSPGECQHWGKSLYIKYSILAFTSMASDTHRRVNAKIGEKVYSKLANSGIHLIDAYRTYPRQVNANIEGKVYI